MGYVIRRGAIGLLAAVAAMAGSQAVATPVDDAASAIANGQPGAANAPLAAWIAQHPDDDRARFLRATALAETDDPGAAINLLEDLSSRYPQRADVWNNLGILYARADRLGKAREALVRAAGLAPNDAAVQRNLGDIYLASARAAYQAAGAAAATRSRQLTILLPALASLGASPMAVPTSASPSTESSATNADVPTVSAGADNGSANGSSSNSGSDHATVDPSTSSTDTISARPAGRPSATIDNGTTDSQIASSGSSNANQPTAGTRAAVAAVLNARAKARNTGNLSGWLAAYSDNFTPPPGENRAQWIEKQHALLAKPLATPMHVDNVEVHPDGPNRLAAVWDQITGDNGPRLTERAQMIKEDGDWQILSLR